MKVLWLAHLVPFPPKGGVLQRTYNLIREMSEYHEITLISFNQVSLLNSSLPEDEDPLAHAKEMLLDHVNSITILDIPEEAIPAGRYLIALKAVLKGSAYNMEWLSSSKARKAIASILNEHSFDAVHLDTISLAPYAKLVSGLPMILNHHNFESEMLKQRAQSETNFFKSLFFRYEASRLFQSEIEFCRKSALNLTCSDDDLEAMKVATGMDNFLTVPNGVDVSYFYPNKSIKVIEKSILIVGGMSWYPNREAVEYFIKDIWPRIKLEFPDITVNIIGRNPTKAILDFGRVEPNVFVHGFVEDIREYLWASHIYLCPIRTGGGTKLKILDALATGCCIIADPFACKGINVEPNKNVLYASEPADYVDRIRDIFEDSNLENRLRENGPRLILDQYSYSSIGKLYSERLASIVEESNSE